MMKMVVGGGSSTGTIVENLDMQNMRDQMINSLDCALDTGNWEAILLIMREVPLISSEMLTVTINVKEEEGGGVTFSRPPLLHPH